MSARALLGGVWALAIAAGPARAQQPDCVTGFRYVEWPERGPLVQSGRPLPPVRGAEYGVDINSRIQITVDTT